MTSRWIQNLVLIYDAGMSLSFGLFVMGGFALIHRRKRGRQQNRLLPGHWLVIFGMMASLADVLALIAVLVCDAYRPPVFAHSPLFWIFHELIWRADYPALAHQIVGWGLGAVFSLGLSWFVVGRLVRAWVLVFLAFGLVASTFALSAAWGTIILMESKRPDQVLPWYRDHAASLYMGGILGCVATIFRAVALDWRNGLRTDWVHWAGVAAWLVVAVIQWNLFSTLTK